MYIVIWALVAEHKRDGTATQQTFLGIDTIGRAQASDGQVTEAPGCGMDTSVRDIHTC